MACKLSAPTDSLPLAWWLWFLSAAQTAAAILLVHARLEARIAARTEKPESPVFFRAAVIAQIVLVPIGLLAAYISYWLTGAMWMAAAVHAYELRALHSPEAIAMPLRTISYRAAALSVAISVLLIVGLR